MKALFGLSAILFFVFAAPVTAQDAEEEQPRAQRVQTEIRTRPVEIDRRAMARETAVNGQPVSEFATMRPAQLDRLIETGRLNVGGRWACSCSGEGQCRAINWDDQLSCAPAEGQNACSGSCSLDTTHDPGMSGPAQSQGPN